MRLRDTTMTAGAGTRTFTRGDGEALRVVEGFRDHVLSYRAAVTPKPDWSEADYVAAAEKKRRRLRRLSESFQRVASLPDGARVLDVGCGDGANCVLLARERWVALAAGIDLQLPACGVDERGEQARRLIRRLGGESGVCLLQMDGTRMGFASEGFDVAMSRSAMEHIKPVGQVLAEMVRVVRRGGLIYLGIDPFFWVRGCHKRGVVDVPWAHARLTLDEYQRLVTELEGEDAAAKRRQRLETLNRFTAATWRETVSALPCDVLDWKETTSEIGQRLLEQFPEVEETLLPGVETTDLLTERIEVWLRKG
jgi:ubiquinone/menaquinone biosynthesis C-methylase UbiE